MRLQNLLDTWGGTQAENRFLRVITAGLLVICLVLTFAYIGKGEVIVLVPPNLKEEVQISKNSADGETKKAWGLYVAQLIGNVTPANADFVAEVIEPLLHPRIYKSVRENLAFQIESLKMERVSLSFSPRRVAYEPSTDRVYVSGQLTSSGLGGAQEKNNRTYEMQIDVEGFRPLITFLDVYKGGIRDEKKKLQMQKAEEARQAREEKYGK